jgi:hypothetical protein
MNRPKAKERQYFHYGRQAGCSADPSAGVPYTHVHVPHSSSCQRRQLFRDPPGTVPHVELEVTAAFRTLRTQTHIIPDPKSYSAGERRIRRVPSGSSLPHGSLRTEKDKTPQP